MKANNFVIITLLIILGACSSKPINLPQQVTGVATRLSAPISPGVTETERLEEIRKIQSAPSEAFVLGRGDLLAISVYNEPDLSFDGIPVRPDGNISFPLVGDIPALGKSVETLKSQIVAALGVYIKNPKVSVIVREFNSQSYTIIGEVVSPGIFPLNIELTVTDAIARSGGLTRGQFKASSIELADLKHAFVSRKGRILPVDFVALLHHGDMRYDIKLRSGDYIHIPSGLSQEVYVMGEVHAPEMFAYTQGMQLAKILVVAKGFNKNANLKQVHIIRGSLQNPELYIVDLNQILAGNIRDVLLEPGDIVYIPPTGLTRWSDTINKILPGLMLSRTTIL